MAPRRSKGPNRYGVGSYGTASDGRHRWRYTTMLATGQKKRIEVKKRELADLDRAVEELLDQEKRLGYALDVNNRTLAQYCETWLEQRVAVRAAPNTVQKYRYDLGLLLPYIGEVKLRLLRPDHIQAAVHALATHTNDDGTPHYRPATISGTIRTLHNALEPLVDEGLLPRNPARTKLLDLPKGRAFRAEISTVQELGRLLVAVRGTWIEILIHTYAETGLRRGEALGLRWSDLDFETKLIRPYQALKIVRGIPTLGTLKTQTSLKPVPMSEWLAEWLEEQRRRVALLREAHGGPDWVAYNLVFPGQTGKPWHPRSMVYTFKRYLEIAELPQTRTIHGLRHSYSTLAGQRANASVVQNLLRHSAVTTSLGYIHSDPSQERAVANAIAEDLRTAMNG